MPRSARASAGGVIYHAMNRGNRREHVFRKPADYDAFVEGISESQKRVPIDIFGYCLMPDHFHLIVRPREDGDLGRWMRGLLTRHALRSHRLYGTTGHVWQGRYKAFPIQEDVHLATALRYIERNPLRAELVSRAEHWKWSSLSAWLDHNPLLYSGKPSPRGAHWVERVNDALTHGELRRLRECVVRGRPFGSESWTLAAAERLGLESSLRPRGRPKSSG